MASFECPNRKIDNANRMISFDEKEGEIRQIIEIRFLREKRIGELYRYKNI